MSSAKKIVRFLIIVAVFYAVSLAVAMLVYPRALFPAPASPPPIPPGVGEALTARAKDGVIANALYFHAPDPTASTPAPRRCSSSMPPDDPSSLSSVFPGVRVQYSTGSA